MKRLTMLCASLLCLAVAPAFASGGTTVCTGKIDSETIQNNLDVPAGASCQLNWVEVVGTVTVEGNLLSFSSQYDKNVTVTGAGSITIANGYSFRPILGNLTVTNSSGQSQIAPANDGNNVVMGNITVQGLHDGGTFSISQATVNGTVNLLGNFGRTDISYLTIGKTLNCTGNNPAPTSWSLFSDYGPHVSSITAVQGKTGQCSAF